MGSSVNSNEKSKFFMHFCKPCTHNGDSPTLSIKTNAHKEIMFLKVIVKTNIQTVHKQ